MRNTITTFGIVAVGLLAISSRYLSPPTYAAQGDTQISSHMTRPISSIETVNEQAKLIRSGSLPAAKELSRTLFDKVGLGRGFADTLGYTRRISEADLRFRRGEQGGIDEEHALVAMNNFMSRTASTPWAQVKPAELRRLRMHLVATYPHLMASQAPVGQDGHYRAIEPMMSPMEVSYLAMTMLYQKAYNADYQLSDTEKSTLDDATAKQLHLDRTRELNQLLLGQVGNSSPSHLLAAGDALFIDLGVPKAARSLTLAGGAQ